MISIIREKVKLEEQAAKSEVIEVPSSLFSDANSIEKLKENLKMKDSPWIKVLIS